MSDGPVQLILQSQQDEAAAEYFERDSRPPRFHWADTKMLEPVTLSNAGIHPDIARAAAQREAIDAHQRGINARGHNYESYQLQGDRIGRKATSADDVQRHIKNLSPPAARALIKGFIKSFAVKQGFLDRYYIESTGLDQYIKYKFFHQLAREERLIDEANKINNSELESSGILENAQRKRDVEQLVQETGYSTSFIEAYLKAHLDLDVRRRFPRGMTVIDPRSTGVLLRSVGPFKRAAEAVYRLRPFIQFAISMFPFVGFFEGVMGRELLTGRRLDSLDRGLSIFFDMLPFFRHADKLGQMGVRLTKGMTRKTHLLTIEAQKIAEVLAAVSVRTGIEAKALLRAQKKMAGLLFQNIRDLRKRVAQGRKRKGFRPSVADSVMARQIDQALQPIILPKTASTARSVNGVPDSPKMHSAGTGTERGKGTAMWQKSTSTREIEGKQKTGSEGVGGRARPKGRSHDDEVQDKIRAAFNRRKDIEEIRNELEKRRWLLNDINVSPDELKALLGKGTRAEMRSTVAYLRKQLEIHIVGPKGLHEGVPAAGRWVDDLGDVALEIDKKKLEIKRRTGHGKWEAARGQLRKNIKKSGQVTPIGDWEAHHIIPWEYRHHPVIELLRHMKGGWDHNSLKNAKPLRAPGKKVDEMTRNSTKGKTSPTAHRRHKGAFDHAAYNWRVNSKLDDLHRQFLGIRNVGDRTAVILDKAGLRHAVMDLIRELREDIDSGRLHRLY